MELVDVKTENNMLESQNEELGKTIFNPNNLISETEVQATNITSIIVQQVTAFTVWFQSFF